MLDPKWLDHFKDSDAQLSWASCGDFLAVELTTDGLRTYRGGSTACVDVLLLAVVSLVLEFLWRVAPESIAMREEPDIIGAFNDRVKRHVADALRQYHDEQKAVSHEMAAKGLGTVGRTCGGASRSCGSGWSRSPINASRMSRDFPERSRCTAWCTRTSCGPARRISTKPKAMS